MKKLIATVICLVAIASTAIPVEAQTRRRYVDRTYQTRRYDNYDPRYDPRYDSRNDDYRYGRDRSVWDKHRDKLTTAGGAVAGALLGGIAGGKKGAVIGAIAGGGAAALYTYKIRDKEGRYRRY